MTQEELIDLLQHPENAAYSTIGDIEALLNEYPYFQALHVLQAKIGSDQNSPKKQKYIGKAAIHTADRANLKRILESKKLAPREAKKVVEKAVETPKPEPQISPPTSVPQEGIAKTTEPEEETSDALFEEVFHNLRTLRSLREKYEFLEEQEEKLKKKPAVKTSATKTATKKKKETTSSPKRKTAAKKTTSKTSRSVGDSKKTTTHQKASGKADSTDASGNADQKPIAKIDLKEQNTLIESFIKNENEISKKQPDKDIQNKKDLSKKSTVITEDLVSENLAEIFIGQGKSDKAIEIYRKLIWKFPQKKSYFASRIEELSK